MIFFCGKPAYDPTVYNYKRPVIREFKKTDTGFVLIDGWDAGIDCGKQMLISAGAKRTVITIHKWEAGNGLQVQYFLAPRDKDYIDMATNAEWKEGTNAAVYLTNKEYKQVFKELYK